MKAIFTLVFSTILIVVHSQNTIPNPNFEQWSAGNPVGWQTSNSFTQQFGATTVSQEAVAPYQGSFSVKLETKVVFGYNIAGLITNGQISVNVNQNPPVTILGGTPFTARPNRFKGYYKYSPGTNDYCQVVALLLKRNNNINAFDTVGVAQFISTAPMNSWALFDVPFVYAMGDTPDTIQVVAISSNPNASVAGSVLWLDSLHFEGGTMNSPFVLNSLKDLQIWYNYNNQTINICSLEPIEYNNVYIYDVLGNKIYENTIASATRNIIIYTNHWKKGIYFVRLGDGNNKVGKIVVY
ncbi:MAG: PCMD domain-containing protein [Bacteroidales bacterium]|nr:PCMD domain-containing protein [Bacteroidales bacterium]